MQKFVEFIAACWNGPITHAVYRDLDGNLHLAAGDYGGPDANRSRIAKMRQS